MITVRQAAPVRPAMSVIDRTAEAKEVRTVIKLIMCLCRHPNMTREQFQDYWLNNHGPFFQKHSGEMRAKK